MEFGKLTVEHRKHTGKNEARRLRASGRVPGICYGPGAPPLPISLSARELKKALDPVKRQNTVIQLSLSPSDDGEARELTVMLKDYQVDPVRRDVQHVDLVVVDVNKEVTVEIPVVLVGRPLGVVDGGQLHTVLRTLLVSCKPADIPVKIEVNVSALKIGDAIHVSDVTMPAGVKAAVAGGQTIASVVAPKAEKTAAEEAAEAAAAAEAAGLVPVAGAVPAAGAAAPAAGAAPAAAGAAPAAGAKGGAEAKPTKETKK
jgi:large subunit ribosomal protein L25